MNRRATRTSTTTYLVSDRLHTRCAHVPAHEIATTVSGWLAELGAHSPLVEDLARAVSDGDWQTARGLGEYLSVDIRLAS